MVCHRPSQPHVCVCVCVCVEAQWLSGNRVTQRCNTMMEEFNQQLRWWLWSVSEVTSRLVHTQWFSVITQSKLFSSLFHTMCKVNEEHMTLELPKLWVWFPPELLMLKTQYVLAAPAGIFKLCFCWNPRCSRLGHFHNFLSRISFFSTSKIY